METVEPLPIQHGTVRLRPEVSADAAFLCALHDSVKGMELGSLPVGDPVRRQLLDMQYRAMTESYHAAFPDGRFDLIALNGEPIGRLISDLNEVCCALSTSPCCRNGGAAGSAPHSCDRCSTVRTLR